MLRHLQGRGATRRCAAPPSRHAGCRRSALLVHLRSKQRSTVVAASTQSHANAAAVSVQEAETIAARPNGSAGSTAAAAPDSGTGVQANGYSSSSPDPSSEATGETFAWTKCWYPVMPLESLNPSIPQHIDLLGRGLVVWGDSSGGWHCLEDRCSHRLAPLSEGRVEGGHIQCCYHGWTFDGAGSCTGIPQINDPKAAATACSSKRACVKSFPTRVSHGLLWVWPESGEGAVAEAEATPVTELPDPANRTPWLIRDLPVRYDTLMENILDPSHLSYAHHGLQGDRYNPALEAMRLDTYTPTGFRVKRRPLEAGGRSSGSVSFEAPIKIRYNQGDPYFFFLVVPTKPGWSRLLNNSPADFPPAPLAMRAYMKMTSLFPGLYHALLRNAVLDGDSYLIHVEERLMPQEVLSWSSTVTSPKGRPNTSTPPPSGSSDATLGNTTAVTGSRTDQVSSSGKGLVSGSGDSVKAWIKACYMPASADLPVMTWRKWLGEFGGQVPTCSAADLPLMPPLMSKRQVLERYEQHTKHCVHCQRTVRAIDAASVAVTALGAAAALAAAVQVAIWTAAAPPAAASAASAAVSAAAAGSGVVGVAVGMLVACCVCGALWYGLQRLRAKFFYEDYTHALKH